MDMDMDMAARLAWQSLLVMFPNVKPSLIDQVYRAMDRNFEETVEIIESNIGIIGKYENDSKKHEGCTDKVKMQSIDQSSLRETQQKETDMDMAARLTWQTLIEMFPNIEPALIDQVFRALNLDFEETVAALEESINMSANNGAVPKKNKCLSDSKVKKQIADQHLQASTSHGDAAAAAVEDVNVLYRHTLDQSYEARREASRQYDLRQENFKKADQHRKIKDFKQADYYSKVANEHDRILKLQNARAASAILSAQTFINGDCTLDLHNLFVAEAMQALDIFLEYHVNKLRETKQKFATLIIITGWGSRSVNNKGRIKPAVVGVLSQRNIVYGEENRGSLRVTLQPCNIPK